MFQQAGKDDFGHGDFVVGDGQPALGHMEDALGGAAVVDGIMQYALAQPVGAHNVGKELIAIRRQRQGARQPGAVQNKSAGRPFDRQAGVVEIIAQELFPAGAKTWARPGWGAGWWRHRRRRDTRSWTTADLSLQSACPQAGMAMFCPALKMRRKSSAGLF